MRLVVDTKDRLVCWLSYWILRFGCFQLIWMLAEEVLTRCVMGHSITVNLHPQVTRFNL